MLNLELFQESIFAAVDFFFFRPIYNYLNIKNMKTIKYTLGIIAMVVTFSSCTVEELELASAAGYAVPEQTSTGGPQSTDTTTTTTDSSTQTIEEIDPPVIPTKP